MGPKSLSLIVILIVLNSTVIFSQDKSQYIPKDKSPEEIMRYVSKAVDLVLEQGEGGYAELTDPKGPWVDGTWYIYVNNFKGFILAHLNKKLEGKNMYGVRMVGVSFGGLNLIPQYPLKR